MRISSDLTQVLLLGYSQTSKSWSTVSFYPQRSGLQRSCLAPNTHEWPGQREAMISKWSVHVVVARSRTHPPRVHKREAIPPAPSKQHQPDQQTHQVSGNVTSVFAFCWFDVPQAHPVVTGTGAQLSPICREPRKEPHPHGTDGNTQHEVIAIQLRCDWQMGQVCVSVYRDWWRLRWPLTHDHRTPEWVRPPDLGPTSEQSCPSMHWRSTYFLGNTPPVR